MATATEEDRWLSRAEYEPEQPMLPPVDRAVDDPSVQLVEHLEKSGILDAPDRIDELSQLVVALSEELDRVQSEVSVLRAQLAAKNEGLERTFSLVAAAVSKSVVAKVELPEGLVRSEVNVPVNEIGEVLVRSLVPVIKALAERPVSEVHHKVIEVTPSHTTEHVHHELTPAQVDITPLVKALTDGAEQQAKVVRKALEKADERSAAQEIVISKVLDKLDQLSNVKPPPERKPVKKKVYQNYEGEWISEEMP